MTNAVLMLIAAGLVAALAFRVARHPVHVPRHRARHMRLRLHLRLHPTRGHATVAELHLRWGRLASWRESKRTRPSLHAWHRLTHPGCHSVRVGRAHYGHQVRVPVQEHGGLFGPPRSIKTGTLSHVVMEAPGAVVCTSSKPDLYFLTRDARAADGRPVYVFNPQGIGGIPNNVRWSPLPDCDNAATAIRRGDAFASAVSVGGTEDGSFWSSKASDGLRAMFAAAAHADADMRRVGRWAGTDREVIEAIRALEAAGQRDWAAQLATDLTGSAEKTTQTIRMTIGRALSFLHDPAIAASVLPGPGEQFDIDSFLASGGTLYMIARSDGEDCTLAPLFAALASEIQHRAVQIGSAMDGGRLDPPLTMALDELTQVCPVPVAHWLADSGGQGVCIWYAVHGIAQLRARWGEHKAQSILDCTNVRVFMPGLADTETLDKAVKLAGQVAWPERGTDLSIRHDAITPDMLRGLPKGFALLIRNSYAPVIIKVAVGWKHPGKRRADRADRRAIRRELPQLLTLREPAGLPSWPPDGHEAIDPAPGAVTRTEDYPPQSYPWREAPDDSD